MRARSAAHAAIVVAALATAAATLGAARLGAPGPDSAMQARLVAAVDRQQLDAATLDSALAATPALRRTAALRAGQAGARPLAPRLRALLADADTAVAGNAAFSLALLHDSAGVSALATALAAPAGVATTAAFALGEIGEPARAAIVSALAVPSSDTLVVEALLYAAAKLRPVPVASVARFFISANTPVRRAAAYAVGRTRIPAGVRPLVALGSDRDPMLRSYVARGLARPAAGDSLGALAMTALGQLATDPAPHVRIGAVRSLGSYGDPAAAAIGVALRDMDANVRIAAAESAADAWRGAAAARWTDAWQHDTSYAVRRALLAAAARPGQLGAALAAWARAPLWLHRAGAASALAPRTDAASQALLLTLRRDRDARVRNAAVDALAARLDSADAAPWLRDTIRASLADPDAIVRASALAALAGKANAREIGQVRRAYERSAGDRDNDARLAALRYLAAAWEADSSAVAPADRAWLAALPAPADPLARPAAGALPAARRWAAPVGTPSPAVDYAAVVRALYEPAAAGRPPRAVIRTSRGEIELELFAAEAPLTVHNFLRLARAGYYRGLRFHRVVGGFVAQDGDPRGDGNGGPGYAIRDENNRHPYLRGTVGMALSGPHTGGSQYFITLADQPHLDAHYTAFARVVRGMDVADLLVPGDRIESVEPRP